MRTDLLRVCSSCRVRTHTGHVYCPWCDNELESSAGAWLSPTAPVTLDQTPTPRSGQPVDGRIVAGRKLRGPLTGLRCAGFALYGQAHGQTLADAAISPFTMETTDGVSITVDVQVAILELRREGPRSIRPEGDSSALQHFLEERGIRMVDLALAEVMLREGDWVRVTGELDRRPKAAESYRRGGHELRLLGDADRPLVIELLDSEA